MGGYLIYLGFLNVIFPNTTFQCYFSESYVKVRHFNIIIIYKNIRHFNVIIWGISFISK